MRVRTTPATPRNIPPTWEAVRFTDAFTDRTGGQKKVKRCEYLAKGTLPVIDQGQEPIGGYTDRLETRCDVTLPCILFGDHTKTFKYCDSAFALGADGVKVLEPRHDVDARFAWHYLSALPLPGDAGYSRHFKFLKRTWFPLPPLPEQWRIAAILDKADVVRRKRLQTLDLADQFLRSAFLDLFGDPVTNPKGWPIKELGDVSELITDGEHQTPERTDEGVKLLSARNVKNGFIDLAEKVDHISPQQYAKLRQRIDPTKGDLLISCSGSIGRVAVLELDEPLALVRSVALVRLRLTDMLPAFGELMLRTPYVQAYMRRGSKASSQANLFRGEIAKLPVLVPPLELQQKVSDLARQWSVCAKKRQAAQVAADALQTSLTQRAFRGEL